MSTSWPTPDPRPRAVAPMAFATPDVPATTSRPPLASDLRAGVLAAVVTLLAGAPVGLLWAASAPRVGVVRQGDQLQLVMPGSNAFIAGDGAFLAAVAVAGVVGGFLAWLLARAHGPAVVAGLTVGGIAAAYVAMTVGVQVGLEEAERLAGVAREQAPFEIGPVKLRAREALVGWPVGALMGYVLASLLRGR